MPTVEVGSVGIKDIYQHDLNEFRTVDQMVEEYPNIVTLNSLRWELRHRKQNGLDKHCAKFGKHILIHVPGFVRWMMQGGAKR